MGKSALPWGTPFLMIVELDVASLKLVRPVRPRR